MYRKFLMAAILYAAGVFLPAHAVVLSITNESFENQLTTTLVPSPPTGWTAFGDNIGGYWNINNDPLGFWTATAPAGNQVAYLASASTPSLGSGIEQKLSDVLAPNTIYRLDGFVGHPIGFATEYQVSLLAGTTTLATKTDIGPQGSFVPFQIIFNSAGSNLVGQPLTIRLFSTHAQTAFDNLSLQTTTVPEPSSWVLIVAGLALILLVGRRYGAELR